MRSGAIQNDFKWSGTIWSDSELYGAIRNDLKRSGSIWNDLERSGTIWNDPERSGAIGSNSERSEVIGSDQERSGVIWSDLERSSRFEEIGSSNSFECFETAFRHLRSHLEHHLHLFRKENYIQRSFSNGFTWDDLHSDELSQTKLDPMSLTTCTIPK